MGVMQIGALLACVLGCVAASPAAGGRFMLPDTVYPVSYDLALAPRLPIQLFAKSPIDGNERINLDVRSAVSDVRLNAIGITILNATVDGRPVSVTADRLAQQITLHAPSPLRAGRHEIALRFTSATLPDSAGLWFDNLKGNAPNLVSLFEPSRVRTVFPCFDEPRFRATFHVRYTTFKDWAVVSNMPAVASREVGTQQRETEFQTTPPMPAYLLTLDAGVFTRVQDTSGRVPISVYARPGQEALARSVLRNTVDSVHYFESAFATPFPLPKLDVVIGSGVLNDVEDGWGAMTVYTESEVSGAQFGGSPRGKAHAAHVIAQNVAAQWFGGLVGIRSWGSFWASGGLAGWAATHAMRDQGVETSDDIDWAWNAISLWGSKGALVTQPVDDRDVASSSAINAATGPSSTAVLDAYEQVAGTQAVFRAARRYLHDNAYQAVDASAFGDAFGTAQARRYGDA